jgi:predicted deacetylase
MSMLSKYMQMGNLRRDLNKIMIVDKSWRKGLDAYKKENLRISEGYRLYSAQFYSMVDEAFRRAKKIAIGRMKQEHPELREKIETRKARQADVKLGRYNNQRILEQVRPPVY